MMFKQITAISAMNLRAILQRPLSAIVTATGVAAMVAVMTALLALGAGLPVSGTANVGPDLAVALAKGTNSDYLGSIPREVPGILSEMPGVRKDSEGRPIVVPAGSIVVDVTRKDDHSAANVQLTGLPLEGFGTADGARLTKGRLFRPGLRELVVGQVASRQFEHLGVGDRITLRGSSWAIVGEYEAGGSTSENGLVGDLDTVLSAFGRNAYQSIVVRLDSPADFARFKDAAVNDPRLSLDVKVLRKYIQDQLQPLTTLVDIVAYFIGTIMGVGVFFGILNTMYSAIDARRREIATLRAVGFRRTAVVISFMLETLIVALPGAFVGAALAWLLFDGNQGQFSSLAFPITVTPNIMVFGVIWTLAIGLIAGLAPSIFAARLPIATALRAN